MRNALYACDNDRRYSEVAYPPLVLKADLSDLFLYNFKAVAALMFATTLAGYQLALLCSYLLNQIGCPICSLNGRVKLTRLSSDLIQLATQRSHVNSGNLTIRFARGEHRH